MNTLRTRRVAATALLAAGGLFFVAAPAQATCMMDDKGQQICGINQSGPTSGPGSYTGNSGINDSSPGALGPDGQPMNWGTPPPADPGAAPYIAPNADAVAGANSNFVPPAPVTVPQTNQNDPAKSPYEYAPPASANNAGAPAGAAAPAAPVANPADPALVADAEASAAASASAATAAASAAATPAVTATMTERAARPTKAATASVPAAASVATERAAATESFNPVPLIAGIGAVLAAAGLVWFMPGARTAVTSVFTRMGKH